MTVKKPSKKKIKTELDTAKYLEINPEVKEIFTHLTKEFSERIQKSIVDPSITIDVLVGFRIYQHSQEG